jgi:hypothetical protein
MSEALTPAVVSFHGDALLTVSVDETPYVPMKPVVEALGLSWPNQAKRLSWGGRYGDIAIPLQTAGGTQDMLAIPLRKLNGWLFSINPRKVRDDVRDKLVRYQEECFEVLYRYWHGETAVSAGLVSRTFSPDAQNRVWYDGRPVLAGSTLAVFYGTDAKTLSNLKRATTGLYLEGRHYHDLKGDDVRRFYESAARVAVAILPAAPPTTGLTLFTDDGARQLALELGRDAQDAYLHLRRTYYAPDVDAFERPLESIVTAMGRAEMLVSAIQSQVNRLGMIGSVLDKPAKPRHLVA